MPTARDLRKYSKSQLLPSEIKRVERTVSGFDTTGKTDNMHRLLKYRDMYDRLFEYRETRRRNLNYTFGKQWSDLMQDPDSPYTKYITEEEHIKRQGKVPLKNNLIRRLTKSVLGTFRGNRTEPMAVARDRDELKLAEMMSIAMQYVYQNNDLWEKDARALEEFLISGLSIQMVRYCWWREKQIYDVKIVNENPSRIFFNADMSDPDGEDLRVVGAIRDMHISSVLSEFAKSPQEAARIRNIYRFVDENLMTQYAAFSSQRFREGDFFIPVENSMCRVIDVWTLESRERLRVHDLFEAETYVVEMWDKPKLEAINKKRMAEFTAAGVSPDDVPLIQWEYFIDEFWCFQSLAPTGETLFAAETPFEHKSHPFVLKAYPMIDGEIHSFVEDVIDQQRYINRLITLLDFIMGSSAKGVLVFPEEMLGDMDRKEVLEEWVKFNGVIFAKTKGLEPGVKPEQISANATNIGAHELLALQLKLMDDISGVHGALQGKQAGSGTSGALYAQEAQNAATNLMDILDTFSSLRKNRDYKMMMTIQQYYDSPRYINIAGKDYSEEGKYYDPEKVRNAKFDVVITESPATTAYRAVMNDFLMELFKAQAIDVKMLLENTTYPFADRVLASIQRHEQAMEAKQAGQPGAPGMEIPPELLQQANPQAMGLINQALA